MSQGFLRQGCLTKLKVPCLNIDLPDAHCLIEGLLVLSSFQMFFETCLPKYNQGEKSSVNTENICLSLKMFDSNTDLEDVQH